MFLSKCMKRENEGDFIAAAECVTAEMINFMAQHGRGLICTPITESYCRKLDLYPMVNNNTDPMGTAFTVSVDLKGNGVTSGISAADRSKTVNQENVFVLNINGTFDDCQDIVKSAFKDKSFLKHDQVLLAVNSINWTRIIGQICYYFYLCMKINNFSKQLCFSVPTGNFGNVFACYSAMKLGLPVKKIAVAVNENDILHRFFSKNLYKKELVNETLSPSMDITVASNFERLIYDFYLERDAETCKNFFDNFPNSPISLSKDVWKKTYDLFCSSSIGDVETTEIMKKIYKDFNYVVDPHTAVGLCVSKIFGGPISSDLVVLSTAHPGKFLDSLKLAEIPTFEKHHTLSEVLNKEEYSYSLETDQDQVFNFIKRNNH